MIGQTLLNSSQNKSKRILVKKGINFVYTNIQQLILLPELVMK